MWDLEILGVDFYHVAAWFYLYSFFGWLWESCYVSVKQKKLVNRGFVNGPLCTIYGVGAVSVYLILRPLEGNWIALYFGGVAVATLLEYVTAVIMERLFHTSWWDYSENKFNFQGRICLGSSVAWGFFALLMFEVLQPFVETIVSWFDVATGHAMIIISTILYAVDFVFAVMGAMQLGKKLEQMEGAMADLAEYFQQTRIYASAEEFLEKLEPYRKTFNRANVKEKMEQYQDSITELLEQRGLLEQKDTAVEKIKGISEKFVSVFKGNWNSRRLMRSYPNLGKASRLHRVSLKKHRKHDETK